MAWYRIKRSWCKRVQAVFLPFDATKTEDFKLWTRIMHTSYVRESWEIHGNLHHFKGQHFPARHSRVVNLSSMRLEATTLTWKTWGVSAQNPQNIHGFSHGYESVFVPKVLQWMGQRNPAPVVTTVAHISFFSRVSTCFQPSFWRSILPPCRV